ncbi:MAG: squalene/phytoene synthase family protein [Alphaproteobacteria bacterium]
MIEKEYNLNIFPFYPFLIKKKYKEIAISYFNFITSARNIADNVKLQSFSRMQDLCELEDVFFYQREHKNEKLRHIIDVRERFTQELLAPALVVDIINALKKDASDFTYEVRGQLVEYYKNYSGTMGRFLLALFDENPSTYMPATSLCTAFQILNNLKNMKYDGMIMKRFYIPKDLLNQYNLKPKDLYYDVMSNDTKRLVKDILKDVKGLLKDAKILPSIIKNDGLRAQFCVLLSLTHILYHKLNGTDFLKKNVKVSKFDRINALITGVLESFFTPYQEISIKKLNRK